MTSSPEGMNGSYDPDTIAALMRERGVSETTISTVDRPDGFRVGFVDGKLVEL